MSFPSSLCWNKRSEIRKHAIRRGVPVWHGHPCYPSPPPQKKKETQQNKQNVKPQARTCLKQEGTTPQGKRNEGVFTIGLGLDKAFSVFGANQNGHVLVYILNSEELLWQSWTWPWLNLRVVSSVCCVLRLSQVDGLVPPFGLVGRSSFGHQGRGSHTKQSWCHGTLLMPSAIRGLQNSSTDNRGLQNSSTDNRGVQNSSTDTRTQWWSEKQAAAATLLVVW